MALISLAQFDSTIDDSASVAVVRSVAAVSGEDPVEMDPLYDAVDPDALDSLYRSSRRTQNETKLTIEFSYNGYRVRLSGDGELSLFE